MPIPKIKTQYEYEKNDHPRVEFNPSDKNSKSKAIQSDMDAADINKIMARFEKTGVILDPSGVERQPNYGDFTEFGDYHAMRSSTARAEQYFNALPAHVRNRFNNDPQELIKFAAKKQNYAELVKLGLMTKKEHITLDPGAFPAQRQEEPPTPPLNTGVTTGQA